MVLHAVLDSQRQLTNSTQHHSFHFYSLSLQMIIPCSWLFGAILSMPEFLFKSFNNKLDSCTYIFPVEWMGRAYGSMWLVFSAFVPISLMVALYSRIVYALWFKRTESIESNNTQQVWNENWALKLDNLLSGCEEPRGRSCCAYVMCWTQDPIFNDLNLISSFQIVPVHSTSNWASLHPENHG